MNAISRVACSLALVGLVMSGCATESTAPITHRSGAGQDWAKLAGLWDYEEETVVVVLSLDENGNGDSLYPGGRFDSTSLEGRFWRGRWQQNENDREGGFEVVLAEDFSQGEGRWWYTRIGSERSPTEPGGTFHLSRSDSGPPSNTSVRRPKGEIHGE